MSTTPKVQRFPKGWVIRRLDGTIFKLLPVPKGKRSAAVRKEAIEQARHADLTPKEGQRKAVNRALCTPPKAQVVIRRRSRGKRATDGNQFSIHVALQLTLMSKLVEGSRKNRYAKVSIGEMGKLEQVDIDAAWLKVYGAWAWATVRRQEAEVADIFSEPIPEDCSEWLSMMNLPGAMTVQGLWTEYEFDPVTGMDARCRPPE